MDSLSSHHQRVASDFSGSSGALSVQASDPMVNKAALSARSRRKLNTMPRICQWMEDTEEQSSPALSARQRQYLHDISSGDISLLTSQLQQLQGDKSRHQRSKRLNLTDVVHALDQPSSLSSSETGSSYSCPDVESDLTVPTTSHSSRPKLTISIKPSPYASRYTIRHVPSPEPSLRLQSKPLPVTPYAPATPRNGFPYYEPRAPAAAYMPTASVSSSSSIIEEYTFSSSRDQIGRVSVDQQQKGTNMKGKATLDFDEDQQEQRRGRSLTRGNNIGTGSSMRSSLRHHSQRRNTIQQSSTGRSDDDDAAVSIVPVHSRPALVRVGRIASSLVPQLEIDLGASFLLTDLVRSPRDLCTVR